MITLKLQIYSIKTQKLISTQLQTVVFKDSDYKKYSNFLWFLESLSVFKIQNSIDRTFAVYISINPWEILTSPIFYSISFWWKCMNKATWRECKNRFWSLIKKDHCTVTTLNNLNLGNNKTFTETFLLNVHQNILILHKFIRWWLNI